MDAALNRMRSGIRKSKCDSLFAEASHQEALTQLPIMPPPAITTCLGWPGSREGCSAGGSFLRGIVFSGSRGLPSPEELSQFAGMSLSPSKSIDEARARKNGSHSTPLVVQEQGKAPACLNMRNYIGSMILLLEG